MNFWITFWSVFLWLGLAMFAVLSVVISWGGLKELRTLLRSLREPEP